MKKGKILLPGFRFPQPNLSIDNASRLICFVILLVLIINIAPVKAEVVCVPWQPSNEAIAHYTYNGREVTLKGIARGAMTQYRWDFGDTTGTDWAPITNSYILQAKHTYNGTVGQQFIATLYGRDADGNESTDKYPVRIYDSSDLSIHSHLDVRVNIAVDEALWYLHKSMTRANYPAGSHGYGQPYGFWNIGNALAAAGAAIDAFQLHGSKANMDYDSDPYVETVQRGLNYILYNTRAYTISNQVYGNPDTNGNGIGITPNTNTYIGGICMVAFASSGAPNRIAKVGVANVYDRTYADIAQDMVDYWAWGQVDGSYGRGGWRYSAFNNGNGDSDMSTTQWPVLGMLAAKENMGSTIPEFVPNELPLFLTRAQYMSKNTYYGGFGYTNSGNYKNNTKTAAGIICYQLLGTPVTDPKIQKALGYLYRHWNDTGSSWDSMRLHGNSYGMYAVMKAMRMPQPDITEITEYDYINESQTSNKFDWYYATNSEPREGLAHYIVRTQQADGSWDDTGAGTNRLYDAFATGWRTLILLKGVSIIPPEAVVSNLDDMEFNLSQSIPLDASDSFHPDLNRKIVSYEWDFSYDEETFVAEATGPVVTIAGGFPETGYYKVALRVTDDNPENQGGAQSSMVAFDIYVHPPCHDPHALVTGPYQGYIGLPVNFDASQSWDPDSENLTFAWDMDNDGLYGSEDIDCFGQPSDATGPKPQWTWDAPYSGGIGLKVSDDGCYTSSEHYTGFDLVHTTVHVGNHPPVSNPGGPYYAYPGSTIQLDAGLSYDIDPADSVTFAWDLDNDGQFDDSTDQKPSFTVGDTVDTVYDICLKVTDQFGEYDIKCTTVTTTVLVVMTEISPGRIDFDRRTGQFCIEISAKNISGQSMEGPIWLVIENISYASITLANPDGTTADGKKYVDLTDLLGSNPLAPDQILKKRICFSNPDRLRFNFTVSLYSMSGLEDPPMAPRSEKVAVGDTVQGDINGEDGVDIADLKIMMRDWLETNSPADVYPEFGDGIVNLLDFALLAENWLEGTVGE